MSLLLASAVLAGVVVAVLVAMVATTALFARLQAEEGNPYHPSWYNGSWTGLDISSHTSRRSSGLNSAISSSMTPPGSGSGGGGW